MSNVLVVDLERGSFTGHLYIGNEIMGNAKIDTGCVFTSIPLMYFGYDKSKCEELKRLDIERFRNGEIGIARSIGIETSTKKVFPSLYEMSDDELFLDESVCFTHSSNLKFNNFYFGEVDFKVNYDRYSYGLIGMSTLNLLDFHCGYSRQLEKFILVGVLKSQEDKSDYYRALEKHFGIVTSCKDLLYYDFLEDEKRKNEASGFFNWLTRKFGGSNEKDK